MAKRKELDQNIQDLKQALLDKKAIFGKDEVIKGLRRGTLKKVFMAKNLPVDTKGDLEHYSKLAGVELIQLDQDNEEIGVLAKQNFFISMVGVEN
ncbi:MAG: ribosomal L7Ae/L30e/S12e/Gadd45 family protein [archaeon]|nr:ribosomal L7Ae/L30e/S12e/Gadd45 family protein [Nanoarchaeota archaeon]